MWIDADGVEGSSDTFVNEDDLSPRELALIDELKRARIEIDQLKTALDTNRTIGAACGILMARLQLSQQEAFDRLRVASQSGGRKLVAVAAEVLFTGALPTLTSVPQTPDPNGPASS